MTLFGSKRKVISARKGRFFTWCTPDLSDEDRIVHSSATAKNPFVDNTISNTKYTWYNFIPMTLLEQFSLNLNRYFLIIVLLQFVKEITPVSPMTTLAPLVVIFSVTALKELFDDRNRAAEDKKANTTRCFYVSDGTPYDGPACNILVGDIVRIREDEQVPCDLLLLLSSTSSGSCFVQTTNLDGETNLKTRQACNCSQELGEDEVRVFRGVVQCSQPNPEVYKFDSRLWVTASADMNVPVGSPQSVSADQLIQQGTTLRNTEWIYGVAVYTGNETKFGMNKAETRIKYTSTELFINKLSVFIFISQIVLFLVLGVVGIMYEERNGDNMPYLQHAEEKEWFRWLVVPARFLLLNSTMIPISLKITLDLCKIFYSRFINWDLAMYDATTQEFAHANNTSLSENLGQISSVLTDKTGTLTENIMEAKKCCIGSQVFSFDNVQSIRQCVTQKSEMVLEFFKNCALNSAVVPCFTHNGDLIYKASSPDEWALVKAAAAAGVKLVARDGPNIALEVNGQIEKYLLLKELEFTSDRKKMSVVVRDLQTEDITLYSKGADDVLAHSILSSEQPKLHSVLTQLDEFASEGLRTLLFAYRQVNGSEFRQWNEAVERATAEMQDRQNKVAQVYEQLEHSFRILGCSSIEDKLQQNVPSTIATLRAAGINFWMLTGDKFSTALQIATACNLKGKNDVVVTIEGAGKDAILACINAASKDICDRRVAHSIGDVTVIIRGPTLAVAMIHSEDTLSKLLLSANAVICCRVTPAQKAQLVALVKRSGKMTLAIGDGGNDVAMIQEAHVGVGIRGKEGLQASRAADYSVNDFKSLLRLLLVHGRDSYLRTSLVAQYSFYKSFCFCCLQIGFAFFSAFSGVSLFNSMCVASYNAVLFPPVVAFIYDRDISIEAIFQYPHLYKGGPKRTAFNAITFSVWLVRALFHGLVILVVCFSIRSSFLRNDGQPQGIEMMGTVVFLTYYWVQTITIVLAMKSVTAHNHYIIWGFVVLIYAGLLAMNRMSFLQEQIDYNSVNNAIFEPSVWLMHIVATTIAVIPVVIVQYIQFTFFPTEVDIARQLEHSEANISV